MSIPAETWQKLTQVAEALGVTRTDLIHDAITQLVDGDGPHIQNRVELLEQELLAVRNRLAATRAALLGETPVAA